MLLLYSTICAKHRLICTCICSISKCLLCQLLFSDQYGKAVLTSMAMFLFPFYQYSVTCKCSLEHMGKLLVFSLCLIFCFSKCFSTFRVRINFSKSYRKKLYGKNLLILVSPEGLLCLSLMGRKFCNFAYFRLLENAISNKN